MLSLSITITVKLESTYGLVLAIPDGSPSRLPGPKTKLTLYEVSISQGTSGGQVRTWTAIQTMEGSLQPLSANEDSKYNKETMTANYRFFVSDSVFISPSTEAKLVEKNQLRYGARKFNITFVENRTEGFLPHYKVLLQEIV